MLKKMLWLSFILVVMVVVATGCGKKDEAVIEEESQPDLSALSTYLVNVEASTVAWAGETQTVGEQNDGVIPVKSGQIMVKENKILSADLSLDMAGVVVQDLVGQALSDLENYLKSDSFFDVVNYPEARLIINDAQLISEENSTDYNMTADLIIKNKTNSVSFPAKVIMGADSLTMTLEFDIDRSLWGIVDAEVEETLDSNFTFTIDLQADLPVFEVQATEGENTAKEVPAESNTAE